MSKIVLAADESSYSVAFTESSIIYSGTHVYGDDNTDYFYDDNTYGNTNYYCSRAYCNTYNETASAKFYLSSGDERGASLYASYQEESYSFRFISYNYSSVGLCAASGRYGVIDRY